MNINEKLFDYVEKNGIKQLFISQQTDISPNAVSQILRNKRKISAEEFIEICDALGIDPNIFKAPKNA